MDLNILDCVYNYVNTKSPVIYLLADRDGKIIDLNEHAKKLTGLKSSNSTIEDFFVEFSKHLDLPGLAKDQGGPHLLNVITYTDIPQTYYFYIFETDNKFVLLGALESLEQEKMKQKIISLNNELNNLTRELHKSNAQLINLNQLKNQFLGMATHDLRKPIGLIMTYADFLEEELNEYLNDEQKRFMSDIQSSGDFMMRIINDFLDVSMIESGRFDLDIGPASLLNIMERGINLLSLHSAKKKYQLNV